MNETDILQNLNASVLQFYSEYEASICHATFNIESLAFQFAGFLANLFFSFVHLVFDLDSERIENDYTAFFKKHCKCFYLSKVRPLQNTPPSSPPPPPPAYRDLFEKSKNLLPSYTQATTNTVDSLPPSYQEAATLLMSCEQ